MKPPRYLPSPPSGAKAREISDRALQTPGAIDLSVGEPDFACPRHIVDAASRAAAEGYTKYSPFPGFISLREKIRAKVSRVNTVHVDVDSITVTTGAAFGMAAAVMAVVGSGDEVLLPSPGYPSYEDLVVSQGAVPRRYRLREENGFRPDLSELKRTITDRTKAIIINTPSNPTGAVFPKQLIENIVDFAVEHDVFLISDEVYEEIVFEGTHTSPASLDPDGRVISIFSFSKTYAMTGWRVGYVVASPSVSANVRRLLGAYTGAACSVSQKAAEAALDGDQGCVRDMCHAYHRRRDLALELLREHPLGVVKPDGAFYLFVNVSMCHMDSFAFALKLLEHTKVAVRPGRAFGPEGEDYVRVCFAASESTIREGLGRMADFIRREA